MGRDDLGEPRLLDPGPGRSGELSDLAATGRSKQLDPDGRAGQLSAVSAPGIDLQCAAVSRAGRQLERLCAALQAREACGSGHGDEGGRFCGLAHRRVALHRRRAEVGMAGRRHADLYSGLLLSQVPYPSDDVTMQISCRPLCARIGSGFYPARRKRRMGVRVPPGALPVRGWCNGNMADFDSADSRFDAWSAISFDMKRRYRQDIAVSILSVSPAVGRFALNEERGDVP